MRLELYPACIECVFVNLEKQTVYKAVKDVFDDYVQTKCDVIECIHAPVCVRIQNQKKIEGNENASMA